MSATATSTLHDVVVVGAGAAGVGIGVTLLHAGVEDVLILDRDKVGSSFAAWPDETRFITPSFPTNSIGMLDLNSIALGSSPAIALQSEHPTGKQYAAYLQLVAKHFSLPIYRNTEVLDVAKESDEFRVTIAEGAIRAKHVVWAAGEFHYPNLDAIPGAEFCVHTATIDRYGELEGDDFVVIGGYESGIDAAYHLAVAGKRVRLLDRGCPWEATTSDPSVALSTYSVERMRHRDFQEHVELHPHTSVASVDVADSGYTVTSADGATFLSPVKPLFAGGFHGSQQMVAHLFDAREDGFPHLSENDESTLTPGLFLSGPAVRHGKQSFCFIYKYRQRFAVVAKAIATSLGLEAKALEGYRQWGMYLDDLSCCGEECVC